MSSPTSTAHAHRRCSVGTFLAARAIPKSVSAHLHMQVPALSRADMCAMTVAGGRGRWKTCWCSKATHPHPEHLPSCTQRISVHAHTHTHTEAAAWLGLPSGPGAPGSHPPLAPRTMLTCDVVHHDGHRGVPDVARDQASEPLLARRVPELQSHLSQGGRGG